MLLVDAEWKIIAESAQPATESANFAHGGNGRGLARGSAVGRVSVTMVTLREPIPHSLWGSRACTERHEQEGICCVRGARRRAASGDGPGASCTILHQPGGVPLTQYCPVAKSGHLWPRRPLEH